LKTQTDFRTDFRAHRHFDALHGAILDRDQPRTTDIFYRMITDGETDISGAVALAAAAEAPYVQVPSHIDVREGNITLVNNDHTLLGLRTSVSLMPFMPERDRLLPLLQSVWYIPAGLDIWNQLYGRYPGRYAMMKGMDVPPPDYGPVVWNPDSAPIVTEGTPEDRLHEHLVATISGDVRRAYGLFLGLAQDKAIRPRLKDQLRFLGAIDLQDTIIDRKARNTGHKSIRARAVTDLADFLGWENARGVFYMGVPDMALGPLYYSLYDEVCVRFAEAFPEDGGARVGFENQGTLSGDEEEAFVDCLLTAEQPALFERITELLAAGTSLSSLGDAVQIGAAEVILRTTEPRAFTDGQHAFDYCNSVNDWIRSSANPYRPRALYLMASFVNDAAAKHRLFEPVLERECAAFDLGSLDRPALLGALDESVLALDIPRATALARAYLASGFERGPFLSTVAVTACKFQDDPHNQKITHSAFEEYGRSGSHLRDRLLLAAVRLLAGWVKMPGERDCYARFESDWRPN